MGDKKQNADKGQCNNRSCSVVIRIENPKLIAQKKGDLFVLGLTLRNQPQSK